MSLEQKDVEVMEGVMYKCSEDLAVSIVRSFDRLEERVYASESRVYTRLSELEGKVEANGQELLDLINILRDEVRKLSYEE